VTRDDARQAIFGSFDGLASAIGMVAAVAITGQIHTLVLAAVALAVGAAVSMAAGEWLSDPDASLHRAGVMGLATLIGSALPALPFIVLANTTAVLGCALVTVGCGALIAELRPGARGRSYGLTFGVLGVASVAAVGASLVAGAL